MGKEKKDNSVKVGTIDFFLAAIECVQTVMHVFVYAGRTRESK